MAEYKKADLKSKITTDLADNENGAITAKTIRNNMLHIVDSVTPIMASGTDVYFNYAVDIRDSGVTSADSQIGIIKSQWNDNTVSAIEFNSGTDTAFKQDGYIKFYTSSSGVGLGGPGVVPRACIRSHGQFVVFGSGVDSALRVINNHNPSGVGVLVDKTHKTLAVPSGTNVEIGHLDTRTEVFTERATIDDRGYLGLGIRNPLEPVHVRHSGSAIRFDVKSRSGSLKNNADIIISKYSGGEEYSDNNLYSTFGLGVDTDASGVGRFFVGYDDDRKASVDFGDSLFVIASGGNASFGSLYPKEKLVVGYDIGKHTVASGDVGLVVGAQYGNAELFVGSGNTNTNISNYARSKWNSSTKQYVIETRSAGITRHNQFILDSTNNNIGFAGSGVRRTDWRPLFNTHVYASGTATFGLENPMGSESAVYIGSNTSGSGDPLIGNWSAIGYKAATNVLKVNNSGSFVPNHLVIDREGHVGINTDSPYDNFVAGTNYLHVYGSNASLLVGEVSSDSAIRLLGSRSTNNTAYIQAGTNASDADAILAISRMDTDSTNIAELVVRADKTTYHGNIALNDKYISNDGADEGIRITNDGKVGINVAVPTYELQLSSNSAGKPVSSVWSVVSDSRVKTEVTDVTGGLDKIANLRPVKFKYIGGFCDCHTGVDPDTYYYNFIAQEVAIEFPEAVTNSGVDLKDHETDEVLVTDVKHLDSHMINVYLVSAIKELKDELETAKARITELES